MWVQAFECDFCHPGLFSGDHFQPWFLRFPYPKTAGTWSNQLRLVTVQLWKVNDLPPQDPRLENAAKMYEHGFHLLFANPEPHVPTKEW